MKYKNIWPRMKVMTGVIRSAAALFVFTSVTDILHGVSWGGITVFQQRFFDKVTLFVGKEKSLREVLTAFLLLALAYFFCQVLNGAGNYVPEMMGKKMAGALSFNIHKKIAHLEPLDFEHADKLDVINKAEEGKKSAIQLVSTLQGMLCFYLPYFLFMSIYLFRLKPLLLLILPLIFIPTMLTQIVRIRMFGGIEDDAAAQRRKVEYYESCIRDKKYYKETRLLGAYPFFRIKFSEAQDTLFQLKYHATMKTNLIELRMKLITAVGYIGILLLLVRAVMERSITIGAFIAILNALTELYSFMEEIICYHIGEAAKGIGKVSNYIKFMCLEEEQKPDRKELCYSKLTLKDVSFTYPGASFPAIEHIDLEINDGETIAIVGENGSGKTTLVKLLMGLYPPARGKVLIDGNDIAKINSQNIFEKISAVFQNFQKYHMTFAENIGISQTDKATTEEELEHVCTQSGIAIDAWGLKEGYHTMLGREFGGTELSGGQWQRIAIARGYFRNHKMIVLDEPTSAIDPYEESNMYHTFEQMAEGKIAVLVTHRMGAVKIADRIIVLKAGRIAEEGTFEELMNDRDSEFQRMYSLQQHWYQEV
ncbi:MAG: ABC transporter ATP-binding protein [Lachnospiraceae bacterium]|nr:ABC transporter ATP-binding protein [Lachnospiraceae bacterium]